jgi:uncharacterized protein (TIGR02646 family)
VRRVAIPPRPPSLDGPRAKRERDDVAEFYAVAANSTLPYPGQFRAYRADDVKKALHEAFHGKCAYCESSIEATQPLDVEHFRPKNAVMIDGKLRPPGYHWLASRWENLLPSCIDCNRPRRQDFPAGRMPAIAGKANQFPLMSEAQRAKADGKERHERPLLLHPYFNDPGAHLEYIWEPDTPERGEVVPRRKGSRPSRIGKTSIDVYALQRAGLIRQRHARLNLVIAQCKLLGELRAIIADKPDDPRLEKLFQSAVEELAGFLAEDQPYSAMCRQVVLAYYPRLFA